MNRAREGEIKERNKSASKGNIENYLLKKGKSEMRGERERKEEKS